MDKAGGGIWLLAHSYLQVAEWVPVVKKGNGLDALLVEVPDAEVTEEYVLYFSRFCRRCILEAAVAGFLVPHVDDMMQVTLKLYICMSVHCSAKHSCREL